MGQKTPNTQYTQQNAASIWYGYILGQKMHVFQKYERQNESYNWW